MDITKEGIHDKVSEAKLCKNIQNGLTKKHTIKMEVQEK
jgi:hypothetical protein